MRESQVFGGQGTIGEEKVCDPKQLLQCLQGHFGETGGQVPLRMPLSKRACMGWIMPRWGAQALGSLRGGCYSLTIALLFPAQPGPFH